jgi:glycosyltransferase involved in cell wall biosynthesis
VTRPLVVLETHPVQYHAPVYRAAAATVPLVVVYGSDFSVAGYTDREFGAAFAWDTDLLSGYDAHFLSRTVDGGAATYDAVTADGLGPLLARLHPAAVLTLGYSSAFDRQAIRAAGQAGRPLLFRGETTDHARSRGWVRRAVRDVVLRRFYRRCSRLLYVGRRSREHYARLGVPDDRLTFSPYCVDARPFQPGEADRERLRPATRRELGLADDAIALLFSGKLVSRKGVDLLPAAVRLLPDDLRRRVVLLFLGDGELRPQLEAECDHEPRVGGRFLGFQNQTALSRFYHAADLLVLPSRQGETWGLVVNEALEHGLPVVAADAVGSVPDLVHPGRTGEVFQTPTAEAVAAVIGRAAVLVGRSDVRGYCRGVVSAYSVAAAAAGIEAAFRAVAA